MLGRVGRGDGEARGCMYFDSEWRLWEGIFGRDIFVRPLCNSSPGQAIINKTKPCTCISLKYNDFNFSYKISSKFYLIMY